jgi:N-methylhydantoinase B
VSIDPVLLEILRNRFRAIADEMADTIKRTAFSVYVKETGDYVAGLTTPEGETFAFPAVFPPMMIGDNAAAAIRAIDDWRPGDIVLTNDPFTTNGWMTHLNDVHMLKPIYADGRPLFFLWDFLHLSDIGGTAPGSITPGNSEVFQEGLRIPPLKLYREGTLDESIVKMLRANSRTPDLNWGDISALVAALNRGESRVGEAIRKYGAATVARGAYALLDHAEARARQTIEQIPDGVYRFADYLEMQEEKRPVRIALAASVAGSTIHLDFTGTDPQVPLAYNFLAGGGRHGEAIYGVANVLRGLDRSLPLNAGLLRPVTADMPEGTILNPRGMPALGVRMATLRRVMEVVHGAFSHAVPDLIPAGSGDQTLIFLATRSQRDAHKRTVSLLQPSLGGSGARATKDGIDGVDAISWLRNVPTEALEVDLPILVHEYRLDAVAGVGRFRGGRGTIFEFESLTDGAQVIARNRNRRIFRPWGLRGGRPGGHSRVFVRPRGGAEVEHDAVSVVPLRTSDVVRFVSSSGAGYGDPFDRDPSRVLADIEVRALTPESARDEYGVVIVDGRVDQSATGALRATRRVSSAASDGVDFGPEREAFEHELARNTEASVER